MKIEELAFDLSWSSIQGFYEPIFISSPTRVFN